MHVARDARTHDAVVKRSLNGKRAPALINLPVALPSIPLLSPILDPLLTPLVDGPKKTSSTTTHSTTTSTSKASSPTTTAGSGSGGGGSGGDSGPGTTSAAGENTQTTARPNPTNGGDSPPTGDNNSATRGDNSPGGDTSVPTATVNAPQNNGSTDPTDTAGDFSIASTARPPGKTLLVAESSSTRHDSGPATVVKVTTIFSNGQPIATQTSTATIPGGGDVDGPDGGTGTGGTGQDENQPHKNPSTGLIAGAVVIGALVLIASILVVLRRRSKNRRNERRQRWWKGRTQASESRWSGSGMATAGSGTVSARSSFATTFEHGRISATFDFTKTAPPLPPPMVEIRDTHVPDLSRHSQAEPAITPIASSPFLISFDAPDSPARPASVHSTDSRSSDDHSTESHSQYLNVRAVSPGQQERLSPMSVRPFSPSESFAFPKPPLDRRSTLKSTVTDDPFVDPTTTVPSMMGTVETVRRPFTPTLHDEVRVAPGEIVRISKIFDDGWALIEKSPAHVEDKGKGKAIQGLIPIDCLREPGQNLPDFITQKRVGSYSGIAV